MKVLHNVETSLTTANGSKAKYSDLILNTVDYAPSGLPYAEQRKRNRLAAAVEDSKGKEEIQFEDEDISTLKSCSENCVWSKRSVEIQAFVEAVLAL